MMASTLKDVSVKVIPSLAVESHQCIEVEISDTDCEILLQENENEESGLHKYRSHGISYTGDDEFPFDEMNIAAILEKTCLHTRMRNIFSNEIYDKHMDSGEDTTFTTFPESDASSDTVTQGSDSNKQVISKVYGTGSLYQPSDSDSSCKSCATSTSSAYLCAADFTTHGSETGSAITQDSESTNEVLRKLHLVENGPLHALSHHTMEENSFIEEMSSSGSEYEEDSDSISDVVLTLIHSENFEEEEENDEDIIQEIEDDFSESESDDDNESEGLLSDSGSDGSSENEEESKLILSDEDEGLTLDCHLPSKIDHHASREVEVVVTSEQRKNKHEIMTILMFDYMLLQGDDDEESFVNLVAFSGEEKENDILAHDC
jgi:hypothetical protein